MDFTNKIRTLRSKAQETQAANKIIDMLKHIESKNDQTTSYRWIWELIQNAKDVANSSGTVDILINLDEIKKTIEFKHNGKLFSTKNIIFLIEQVSTKERSKIGDKTQKTTGKFGTGFLTTHLLSKKVDVSGYLQDDDDKPYSFSINLDRSSTEQNIIIKSIEESCLQLDKNSIEINYAINDNDFNTCFTYHLDNIGIKTAKNGIYNLIVSIPYVFAFVPEINSITVSAILCDRQYHQTIIREETKCTNLENANVISVNAITNGKKNERSIFVLADDVIANLVLAVEVNIQNGDKSIKPKSEHLPILFCDFPLLGTDDFSFPVVINSSAFNPTEPRDGIYLTDKEYDDEEPQDIKENKKVIVKATELYITLLDYFLSENYKGIYNITKISEPPTKEWLSEAWLNTNIINKLKTHIQEVDLIDTHAGIRKPLKDCLDASLVLIPNHLDSNIRTSLWKLSSNLIPKMIPKYEDLEYWYYSLWNECHNYSVEDLIKRVEELENINSLDAKIDGDVFSWLNEFYNLVFFKEYEFASKLNNEPRIIPNQNGDFCSLSSLCYDCNIEEKYKEISLLLDIDLRSKLIDKRIAENLSQKKLIRKYKFEDLVPEIQKALKSNDVNNEEFHKNIICLKCKDFEKQNIFLSLGRELYSENFWVTHTVDSFSNEIFDSALEYWIQKICNDICHYGSIEKMTMKYNFKDESAAVNWISKLIDYITRHNMDHLLERTSVLPNQNGDFKRVSELSLDSGEIEEVVKDVCEITGYKIRETLLMKDIFLKLPKNRTVKNDQFADRIINYIRVNKNKLGKSSDEKSVFQSFYNYLRAHRFEEQINTPFNELCLNLHWFYNDDDIATNMQTVDEYNNILTKYGVSNKDELEAILAKHSLQTEETEKIEISLEQLTQWGISTQDELNYALANNMLGPEFVCESKNSKEMFDYVQDILERSKNRIINYLSSKEGYDLSNIKKVAPTVFVIKKEKEEIYLMARPSDGGEIRLYYETERDILDYSKDWELWVEDGKKEPEKITFGKMIKLTGINRIPLTRVRGVR